MTYISISPRWYHPLKTTESTESWNLNRNLFTVSLKICFLFTITREHFLLFGEFVGPRRDPGSPGIEDPVEILKDGIKWGIQILGFKGITILSY